MSSDIAVGRLSLRQNGDYVRLLVGLSQTGTAVTAFVIPWMFLQLTDRATQTGILFALGFVPYLFVSLPAGVFADRWNRKVLLVVSDVGRMLMLLAIPLSHLTVGSVPLFLLYLTQAMISGLSAVFDAAYDSCLPNLVDTRHLQDANNTMQTTISISRILGPIIGGAALFAIGSANTLLLDVASYAVSILTTVTLRGLSGLPGYKYSPRSCSSLSRVRLVFFWCK